MSQIKITNLTFAYEGSYDNVFENVSFNIDTDWKLGFTGRNGRGKTTFLNLLLGRYDYTGSISHNTYFEYFPFEIEDKEQSTIDIIEQIYPDYTFWKISKELSGLGMDDSVLFRQFNTLSNGEQTKVMLSVLFSKDNNFLLIDEPTNHLDEYSRRTVAKYLCSKKGFILVSHDRAFLDACTDHTLSINKNNIEVVQGNFSVWLENKEKRDSYEIAQNNRLKKEISKLRETAAEKAKWSDKTEKTKNAKANENRGFVDKGFIGHRAAKMMARSKNIEARAEKKLDEKSQLLKNIENSEDLKLSFEQYHSDTLIYAKDLSVLYDNVPVCKNVSFEIKRGDRIALKGKNGSGKSSIIKLLCGEKIDYTGEYKIGSGLKISYVPQDTSHLSGSLKEFALNGEIDESLFKSILRKMDFSREQFDKDIQSLSEGQKKKIVIAKSLCENAHIYIWDEPLNYIDIFSRIQIENLICRFKPTLLFVEHDISFCEKVSNKIILTD